MRRLSALCLCVCGGFAFAAQAADFTVATSDRGVTVKLDGALFTEYLIATGPKPILWPVIGPNGEEMTRAYPMKEVEGEKKDHPHHRSIFFTHGIVNGVDFWSENKNHGRIVHRKFAEVAGGGEARIATENDWLDAEGKRICQDRRVVTLRAGAGWRSIDLDITVLASDGPLTFGATKEGSVGVRVPTVMDVDAKKGGRIVNSEGQTDGATWGKRARWVDYHGTLGGKRVGIAFLNHPTSFRHPTWWHVRTYGLYAANPFGIKDFDKSAAETGDHTIPAGQTMVLRHRIILHNGDEKAADIAAAFAAYAKEEKK